MKKTYFLSDAHLGSWAIPNGREQEKRIVRFLDSIKSDAQAVYMLGDMFDFWHEYRYVVPKGHVRLLGKICELTDAGIDVHFFTGNHDLWCGDYLEKECGVILHRHILHTTIGNKQFVMAHGDGMDHKEKAYCILRRIFHNRICQRLFAAIHPRWGVYFGLEWARRSRLKHDIIEGYFRGTQDCGIYNNSLNYQSLHPEVDFFLYGHLHIDVDIPLGNGKARFIVLGDWVSKFSYAVFDGEQLVIKHFLD